jgi:transcriptional regulator with GAF, ATPase, and Fis domain
MPGQSLYAQIMREATSAAHRVAIEAVLEAAGRSVHQAARLTGTTPGAIYKRMKALGMDRRRYIFKPGNAEWQALGADNGR